MIKTCVECGRPFETTNARAIVCGKDCRRVRDTWLRSMSRARTRAIEQERRRKIAAAQAMPPEPKQSSYRPVPLSIVEARRLSELAGYGPHVGQFISDVALGRIDVSALDGAERVKFGQEGRSGAK